MIVEGTGRSIHDNGLTLVELLVTMLLGVLVLSIVGGIIVATTTTQASISAKNSATLSGQVVATSIQTEIRNSQNSFSSATTATAASPTFLLTDIWVNDQMLVALVAGSGASYSEKCVAWYYSAIKRTIRFATSSSPITAPTASILPTWQLLASGVSPTDGSAVFSSIPHSNLPSSIAANFAIGSNGGERVKFSVTAISRTGLFGSSRSCY